MCFLLIRDRLVLAMGLGCCWCAYDRILDEEDVAR